MSSVPLFPTMGQNSSSQTMGLVPLFRTMGQNSSSQTTGHDPWFGNSRCAEYQILKLHCEKRSPHKTGFFFVFLVTICEMPHSKEWFLPQS
jgi:hypothetical protein